MGRRVSHYVPAISRQLVAVLYHERKRRGIPMTKLVDEILTGALRGTDSWKLADPSECLVDPLKYRPAA